MLFSFIGSYRFSLVNQYGELMHQSFINYQRLDLSKVTLDDLSLTNVVTGCTVLMNRLLIDLLCHKEALMHDCSALVAVDLLILFLNEATILYRQHSNNVLGAHRIDSDTILRELFTLDSIAIRIH